MKQVRRLGLAYCWLAMVLWAATSSAAPPVRLGLIDVSGKGIRLFLVENTPEVVVRYTVGGEVRERILKSIDDLPVEVGQSSDVTIERRLGKETVLPPITVNANLAANRELRDGVAFFQPEQIDDAVKAVMRLVDDCDGKGIARDSISIVVTSGLIDTGSVEEMISAIQNRSGIAPEKLTSDGETLYTIQGLIPAADLQDAALLDIGSSKVLMGYFEPAGPQALPWLTFQRQRIPGAITLLEKCELPPNPSTEILARNVVRQSHTCLLNPLTREVAAKPGFVNSRKVYLTGGTAWAMACLLYPDAVLDASKSTVSIQPADFERYRVHVLRSFPQFAEAMGSTDDSTTRELINRVRRVFTPEQLFAGAQLMHDAATVMRLQSESNPGSKQIFFCKDAQSAWVSGFLNSKNASR